MRWKEIKEQEVEEYFERERNDREPRYRKREEAPRK